MTKKDKLFLILFIFSINSIFAAIILKTLGVNIFNISNYNYEYPIIETALRFLILIIQYSLIVGCITRLQPKELLFKVLPYLPLTLILYYLPNSLYFNISALILFVTCLSIIPKFSTIIRYCLNIILISSFQLIMIWLRLDIKQLEPIFPSFMQMLVMNIDQFIILFLLYFMNRKWGDIYVAIFRRKK
jgi:hypothetical protein